MPLEVRSFRELYDLGRSLLRSYIPGADVAVGEYEHKARVLAGLFLGNQGQAQFVVNQIFPESSEAAYLERHALARRVPDLNAAKATGNVLLTASSGTDTQGSASVLSHDDGTTFKTTAPATIAVGSFVNKTVVDGSTKARLLVAPDTTSMSVGQLVEVSGEVRNIEAIDSSLAAIDLGWPLNVSPTPGTPINPVRGVLAAIAADVTGPKANKPTGDVLTLAAPVGAIAPVVTVVGLSGGADASDTENKRARVVAHDQQPPGAGNPALYRKLTREFDVSGRIEDAIVYPNYRGMGTIDIIPIGPSGARRVSSVMVTALQTYFNEQAEVPYCEDILVLQGALGDFVRVEFQVKYETGFEPDWSGSFSIQAGSTKTRLLVASSPVGTIEVGDRMLIAQKVGGVWTVVEAKAASVAATHIDLATPLAQTPIVNPDGKPDITPSGPLGLPVINAVNAVFDRLGPGVFAASGSDYIRFPRPSEEWDPVLRLSDLNVAVKSIAGVRDVVLTLVNTVGTPANQTPAAQTTWRRGQITPTFVSAT